MSQLLGLSASLLMFFLYFLGTLGLAAAVLLLVHKLSGTREEKAETGLCSGG
jgi:hypothetical protein